MSNFPARELAPLPPPPPWGRLTDEGRAAAVIRFVTSEATYSWPLHGVVRWDWKDGDSQTLTIFAAGAAVTIHGRRLEVLRDALDAGRLERVQVMSERSAPPSSEPFIRGITVASR
jgi:hypothetical protein